MSRWWAVLLGMFLVGCSGATPSVRHAPGQQELCGYFPRRDVASGALNEAFHSARAGVEVVPVAAPLGASTAAPLAPFSSPPVDGLSGEGLGDGVPRGVLRLVPEGGTAAEGAGTGGAAGELVVTGGAVVAAAGSVLLVCVTVSAAVDGAETPIEVADQFYGTHFGDMSGWVQGQPPVTKAPKTRTGPTPAPLAPPGASPKSEPDKGAKKSRGRIYVTYTKFNKITHRYYSGRTSMVVDLTKPLEAQAWLAVILRDVNHHIDENDEPNDAAFDFGNVDEFDVGAAIDYGKRYDDVAYWRIRGREQQLIDSHGGAWSDTGKPYRTENAVRGVAKDNPWSRRFHDAATDMWGQLYPYTGY
jgi:hypothetical protein